MNNNCVYWVVANVKLPSRLKWLNGFFFCRIFCIMKLFIKRGKNTFHLEITFTFFNQTKVFSLLRLVSLWSGFFSWFWNLINVSKKISSFIKLPEIYKVHLIVHLSCASWNKFQFFWLKQKSFFPLETVIVWSGSFHGFEIWSMSAKIG